jgi:hypothetical protein
MKTIANLIFAFAIIAAAVIGTAVGLTIQPRPAPAGELCVGLNCWPSSSPIKHRPAQRQTLPPVW